MRRTKFCSILAALLLVPLVTTLSYAAEPLDVESFGAVCNGKADDTQAIQRAINTAAGRALRLPAGTCVITRTITYLTDENVGAPILLGLGRERSRIDSRVRNGPAFHFASKTSNRFQRGGRLQDFSIITTTRPPGGDGVLLRGVWQFVFESIGIRGLGGDGIRIQIFDGDPDGSVEVQLRSSWIADNGGLGLDVETRGNAVEHSFFTATNTYFMANAGGGARFKGLIAAFRDSAFVMNRGIGGLLVAHGGANNVSIDITNCDFENNEPRHLDIESAIGAQVRLTQFLSSAIYDPIEMIRVGGGAGGSATVNVEFYGAFMRNLRPNAKNVPGFHIYPTALYTRVRATRWDAHPGPRFVNEGLLTRIEEDGYDLPTPSPTMSAELDGSSNTYLPDATRAAIHQITFRAPDEYVIDAPKRSGSAHGLELTLDLVNRSEGEVRVKFHSSYEVSAFSPPGPGERRIARFYFNAAEGWVQMTPWVLSRAR